MSKKLGFKQIAKTVSFPVFHNAVEVVRTENIVKSIQHFDETRDALGDKNDYRWTRGITIMTPEDEVWVFLPWKSTPGVEAHEAIHARLRHI